MLFLEDREVAEEAVTLSRVSTGRQYDEGCSIDSQTRRLNDYCKNKNLEIAKSFEFAESSTVGNRKKFMEAIEFAKNLANEKKKIIAIVIDKVDRLQRNFKQSAMLYELVEQGIIEIHFYTENCIIHKYSTSNEKLIWNINVTVAQNFVDNIRDNVNHGIEQKLLSGECVSTAPIGYINVKNGKKADVLLDHSRVPLIRKLFDEYSRGLYSIPKLTKKAKEWGLTSSKRKKSYLGRSSVHDMLNNTFYYGVLRYKKGNKYYSHVYEPIITKELFDKCQSVMKGENKVPFKWGGNEYIFRGLITYGITGRVVSAETKKRISKDGIKCEEILLGAYKEKGSNSRIYTNEKVVLEQVEKVFASMYIEPDLLSKIIKSVRESAKYEKDYYNTRITELNKELISIKSKLDNLRSKLLENIFTNEEY